MKINSEIYVKTWRPYRGWTSELIAFVGRKNRCIFNMIMSDPTQMLLLQQQYTAQIWSRFTDSLQLGLGTVWYLVVWISQEMSLRNPFHMWQAAMGKWFLEHPEEFYTERLKKLVQHWQCCIKLEGHYVKKRGTEAQYAFWAVFCVIHFDNLSDIKIKIWKHYFPNTLHTSQNELLPVGLKKKIPTLHNSSMIHICFLFGQNKKTYGNPKIPI